MMPMNRESEDQAVEALIAASLSQLERDAPLTEEELGRYIDQRVTLISEDRSALEDSKEETMRAVEQILQSADLKNERESCSSKTKNSESAPFQVGKTAPSEFIEAILIAQLTRLLSSNEYPLGRFRYTKFAYFSHRKAEDDVCTKFLKKAAGPYSPAARYKGPEGIALRHGYIKWADPSKRTAFIVGDQIAKIDQYLSRYRVCLAVGWVVSHFRYTKNEDLELLSTVDFAAVELKKSGAAIDLEAVKKIIATDKEWAPKLNRAIFSNEKLHFALDKLQSLFPATYGAE